MENFIFRNAEIKDIVFLTKVIIEAEKSGTNKLGLARIFNINESDLTKYLIQIFEEEIDGCEFSISSFLIAEYEQKPVAAFGGWIENENSNNLPSAAIKSNLISIIFNQESLKHFKLNSTVLNTFRISREPHTLQLEYAFVNKNFRGRGLINIIIDELIKNAKKQNSNVKKSQVQVFENNLAAIKTYQKSGFKIVNRFESQHPEIMNYFPYKVKLLMEKIIS